MVEATAGVVSVVIPTFGRAESVMRLLRALKDQRASTLEVVIVDQNEPGWLAAQLSSELLSDAIVVPLEEPNVAAARNVGFRASTGDIVLFIDDDLVPHEAFCANAVAVLTSHPTLGCLCPIIYGQESREEAVRALSKRQTGKLLADGRLIELEDTISAAMFFRRDYFARTGGFDDLLFRFARAAEDQEFFLRMRLRGLSAWADLGLTIYHDEGVPGGCELRSRPYWITREKCVRSWAYRYRIHRDRQGALAWQDVWRLLRSALLNRGVLRQGPRAWFANALFLSRALGASRRYVAAHLERYASVITSNHIAAAPEPK